MSPVRLTIHHAEHIAQDTKTSHLDTEQINERAFHGTGDKWRCWNSSQSMSNGNEIKVADDKSNKIIINFFMP